METYIMTKTDKKLVPVRIIVAKETAKSYIRNLYLWMTQRRPTRLRLRMYENEREGKEEDDTETRAEKLAV
jgi:hypothetical protein